MPAFELGEHVELLAKELGVFIIPPWVGSFAEADEFPTGASGWMEVGEEQGAPIIWVSDEPTSAEPYLVALHELGHHARPGHPRGLVDVLFREQQAWEWAEEVSLIPITPHLRAFIERRLDSYRDN